MKISVVIAEGETGTALTFADALIEHFCGTDERDDWYEKGAKELAEVVDHVQVFLKHHAKGGE